MSPRKIFAVFLIIGLIIFALGVSMALSYYNSPTRYFMPEKRGFGVALNHTRLISPNWYSIDIYVKEKTAELSFYYSFEVVENGTYNFIFFFPFEVISKIESTDGMNFNTTSYGTAIWLKHEIFDVITDRRGDIVNGRFLINNTFQSGTKGEYSFILPFKAEIPSNIEIASLRKQMGVGWHSPAGNVILSFIVPENLRITQVFPQINVTGPDVKISTENKTITSVKWEHSWLDQSFIITCSDSNETQFYQSVLFLSGIFISAGISLLVKTTYDIFKNDFSESDSNNEDIISGRRSMPFTLKENPAIFIEQYKQTQENQRSLVRLLWEIPAIAIAISSAFLVVSYSYFPSNTINHLGSRTMLLFFGSLLMFVVFLAVIKHRHFRGVCLNEIAEMEKDVGLNPIRMWTSATKTSERYQKTKGFHKIFLYFSAEKMLANAIFIVFLIFVFLTCYTFYNFVQLFFGF